MVCLALFLASTASALPAFPGLLGMSFSSGSGISSGLSISSSTNIIPSQSTPIAVAQPAPSSGENIPPQWIIGTREGNYFDPVSGMNWVYDKVLKKFYSPSNGWFLVTQFSPDGKPFAQFYYDPKAAVFIDMATGATIQPGLSDAASAGQQSVQQKPPSIQQVTPTPTQSAPVTQQKPPATQQGSAIVNEGNQGSQQAGSDVSNPCRISCSDCTSGYCDDCNGNGKCDNSETSGDNSAGQSEVPQVNPLSTQSPSSTEGISEAPQDEIKPAPTSTLVPDEGLSEEPQSTILYMEASPDSGILAVIACESGDTCGFCLDNDEDGVCTSNDCAIMESESGSADKYCVDCDRDGICDDDKKFVSNCKNLTVCSEASYCIDYNNDGFCDSESPGI
ncbi:MAG: hypothetical protein CVV33_05645 [Methanomicrobiales archaeon HGW-Methanomicrobiales-4]|nr:MAG: hypothetical protein CVV33_05645 [Methanomicrobiales archaeon HGW-Methanomicrobiales-4]